MSSISNIKKNGFHIFKSIFSKKEINIFHKEILKMKTSPQENFFKKGKLDSKAILNLQKKNLIFLKLLNNKLINRINKYFLNDKYYKSLHPKLPNYILSQYAARSAGKKKLVLHFDDKVPNSGDNVNYLQWAIPMIDLNKKNGCTQVIPKSHKFGLDKPKIKKKLTLKDLELKIGDMAVWDGRIWHSARPNTSNKERWVIILTFCKWFFKPHYDIPRSFPKKYYNKINQSQKIILGFASIPKLDEKSGVVQRGDLKSANKFLKNKKF